MGLLARWLGRGGDERDLVADLTEEYRVHVELAERLRQHAERARYPQIGAQLRGLADEEDRHAGWLRDRIQAHGGGVPPVAPTPLPGKNQWERAVAVSKVARTKRQRLVERIARWDPEDPDTVALLRRIEAEDVAQLALYDAIVMRSDPQALD